MITLKTIQDCQHGRSLAQRKLFEAYSSHMFNVCLRYMKHIEDAEDMLSQGFARVFIHIKQFEYKDEKGLRAWIKRIVINECLMELRKGKNFLLVSEDEAWDVGELDCNLEKLDAEYIFQAILTLPPGYRAVLNLNIIEGFSHAEISAMLNIDEGTSRSQLSKARTLLKEKLSVEKSSYGKRKV